VLVGSPASGKSTLAKKLAKDHGYEVVNQDTLGSKKACIEAVRLHLGEGRSVIVDNTNRDVATRYCSLSYC
jgi:bifunctional polynucleotide phosphatase/kinase